MVRTSFHFRHQTLHESSGRKSLYLCQIIHGHSKTKYWGLPSDTPIPELRSRMHGPLAPTLSHKLPGSCHQERSHMGFQRHIHLAIVTYTRKKEKGDAVATTTARETENHMSTRKTAQITSKVCACVTKLSMNNASFLRNYTES